MRTALGRSVAAAVGQPGLTPTSRLYRRKQGFGCACCGPASHGRPAPPTTHLALASSDRLGLGAGRPPWGQGLGSAVVAGAGRLLQGQHQVRRHQEHRPARALGPANLRREPGWAPGSGPEGPAGCAIPLRRLAEPRGRSAADPGALPRRPVRPAPPLPHQPSEGCRSAVLGRSGRRSALGVLAGALRRGGQPPSAGAGGRGGRRAGISPCRGQKRADPTKSTRSSPARRTFWPPQRPHKRFPEQGGI